jgi:hypothetical protein
VRKEIAQPVHILPLGGWDCEYGCESTDKKYLKYSHPDSQDSLLIYGIFQKEMMYSSYCIPVLSKFWLPFLRLPSFDFRQFYLEVLGVGESEYEVNTKTHTQTQDKDIF